MKMETAKEIIACLPDDKTAFRYCQDRYAAFLLSAVMGEHCQVKVLQRSVFGKLLNQRLIKPVVDKSGYGVLYKRQLEELWTITTETFLLTLDTWGKDDKSNYQVSRPGVSLVLQLNFSNKHDEMFRLLAEPENDHMFRNPGHPVMTQDKRDFFRETLAWVRIDVDFNTNEALIEELQNDWLRQASRICGYLNRRRAYYPGGLGGEWRTIYKLINSHHPHYRRYPQCDLYGLKGHCGNIGIYLSNVIYDYGLIWDEALLTATLQFIHQELGIANIYMHTPDSGAAVKNITYRLPPRSIYSDLPRRFCFGKTAQAPEFLCREPAFRRLEKKLGGTRWNYLNLGEHHANIAQAAKKHGRPIPLAA